MVLAIRGSYSLQDLVTDLVDRPVDISTWLPEGQAAGLGPAHAHGGIFAASKAVLRELNRTQILPLLLTGDALPGEERDRQDRAHRLDTADRDRMRRRRGRGQGGPLRQARSGGGGGDAQARPPCDGESLESGTDGEGPLVAELGPEDYKGILSTAGGGAWW